MFVSGAVSGQGAAGPVPGLASGSVPVSVSGPGTPRKFSEKIAMLTQRQAEDTAAFREVMMDITATRLQVQRARQVRGQGSDYGGSLPNVNQTGGPADLQGRPTCGPDAGAATRRPPIGEWNQGDGRVSFPLRPIRRHLSLSLCPLLADLRPLLQKVKVNTFTLCSMALLCYPQESFTCSYASTFISVCPSNLCSISQHLQPPITALNRTNSDSALHTSLRNTHTGGHLSPTHTFRNRHSVFLYPAPPIEENVVEEGKLSWSHRKAPASPSGNKSVIPGISVLLSPDLHVSGSLLGFPSSLSASGSLPDLSCLHLPSPQPPPKHHKEEPLSVCSKEDDCPLPGLSSSLQGSLSNPLLPASLSNPNIQTSLSSHSLPASLRSASLDLSLSNPSLQSCPSNQSLQSFFSNSSLSSQSIQSAASVCSYSSGIGGSRSCSSSSLSCSPRQAGQSQASVVRRRAPLSPLVVPIGGESRCHHFSPVGSPTLSPITQGVLLDTNQLPKELRPAGFSLSQSHLHLQARSDANPKPNRDCGTTITKPKQRFPPGFIYQPNMEALLPNTGLFQKDLHTIEIVKNNKIRNYNKITVNNDKVNSGNIIVINSNSISSISINNN
ncbi:CREB-regulated transcription coactivator 2-like [Diretmus argenteus]